MTDEVKESSSASRGGSGNKENNVRIGSQESRTESRSGLITIQRRPTISQRLDSAAGPSVQRLMR